MASDREEPMPRLGKRQMAEGVRQLQVALQDQSPKPSANDEDPASISAHECQIVDTCGHMA